MDGVNYFHVKVAGLLFVATMRTNTSPSLVLELLQRIARVIKDYLGLLNEDSLRKNFVLVYELLDEVIVSALCNVYIHNDITTCVLQCKFQEWINFSLTSVSSFLLGFWLCSNNIY